MPLQRVDKILSAMGLLTRSECARAARAGRIRVDGVTVRSSDAKADTDSAEILLDGVRIEYSEHTFVMLNKPEGYVSATDDPREMTVLELLPEHLRRRGLFPAGRLDKDSVGLLVLTNDGVLAHRLLSPKYHVEKQYFVRLAADASPSDVSAFAAGIEIDGGDVCKPAGLEILPERCAYVTLTEGKYHQVKRMFEAVGNHVEFLERVRFGRICLDPALERGSWRMLEQCEIDALRSGSDEG